jgi:ABC-type Fe3+/spermidine/putrescine transport system ATPase subunit
MLRLDSVAKHFDAARTGEAPVRAVDDVTLDVAAGEFLTLLGPSGCGKTTTLRLIAGFETPTAGRIEIAGADVTRRPPQHRPIGMVFQHYALFPHLDVFENVAFGLRARGAARRDVAGRVGHALSLVGLDGLERRRVQELSGGQQQRVALARSLAPEPPLLLLDEPLSNLDASLREKTRGELRALVKRLEITAVFVTHDQDEAFALSDRIVLLDRGRVQQIGAPEVLYEQPANAFVAGFIGRANFLPARVLAVCQDGALECEVGRRGRLRARPAAELGAASKGDRVRLLLRPERIRLEPVGAAEEADGLYGAVADRRFAGATVAYRVTTFGGELHVSAARDVARAGDRVRIRPAGPVLAFPPAEG